MDYLGFFGLKEDPFRLTPDPAFFYPSDSHNEGLMLMNYSIDQKEGFVLVTGDPGTGKTTLLRVFMERWKSKAETAIVLTPRLSPEEFLVSVAEDLNIDTGNKNKNELIRALRDFMTGRSQEDRRVIIIVDEAQNMPDETMEELRLLSNLETDKDKLLQIILLGQPELEPRMMTDRLRQLNQRITTRIHLRHFTAEETTDYVNYRIIKAGKENLKISTKAGRLAFKLTNGIPRLINMLMSRALMASYLEESSTVLPRHIHHAVKSLNHTDIRLNRGKLLLPVAAGIIFLFLLGYTAFSLLQHKNEEMIKEASVEMRDSLQLPEEGPRTQADRADTVRAAAVNKTDTGAIKEAAQEDARVPAETPGGEAVRSNTAEEVHASVEQRETAVLNEDLNAGVETVKVEMKEEPRAPADTDLEDTGPVMTEQGPSGSGEMHISSAVETPGEGVVVHDQPDDDVSETDSAGHTAESAQVAAE